MSDYLGNLVARSFVPSQAVRPQIPSIFEPPPATGLTNQPADLELATESATAPPNLPAPAVSESILQRSERENLHAPVASRRPSATARITAADEFNAASPPRPDGVASITTASAFASVSPALHASAHSAITPRSVESLGEQSRSRAGSPMERDAEPPHARETLPRPRSAETMPAGAIVYPSRAAREMIDRPAPITGDRESRRPSQSQTNSAPAPSINVTIGRVEVRAFAPPAPARTNPKKGPEMSLETYLQRRVEGGRR